MSASCAASCALPAGQRCFGTHRPRRTSATRRQAALCSSARRPAAADAAAAHASSSSNGGSSKRQLLLGTAGLLAAGPLLGLPAAAEEAASSGGGGGGSRRVFFDISGERLRAAAVHAGAPRPGALPTQRRVPRYAAVDRKPFGRFVVEVPAGAPRIGGQRFLDLAQGKEGVRYRKTKIELIEDGFVQAGAAAAALRAGRRACCCACSRR